MATKTFISFDYDNDEDLEILLLGQFKHHNTPFGIADWSIKEAIDDNWEKKARTRIKAVDVVAVYTGALVAAEVKIAQEKKTTYFLFWGNAEESCAKPSTALSTGKMCNWRWENLKTLIGVGR